MRLPVCSSLVVLFVVDFLVAASPLGAQTLTFARTDYAASIGARTIVTADFNRDGWPDLAEAGTNSDTLTVVLNARGQGFTRGATVAVGRGPFDMATDDFNRDGIPDIAVANADGESISVLLGRGDGTFTTRTIETAAGPRGIATGDVDEDGIPDIVCTTFEAGIVDVFSGDGTGGFTRKWRFVATQPQGVEVADIDRDGHLDLVVAQVGSPGLVVFRRSGTTFVATPVTGEASLNVLAVADLNRDGRLDVAAASTDRSRVAIYLGSANGLVFQKTYAVNTDPRGITIGDVTGDGIPDVITASRSTSAVTVLPGSSAPRGTFLARATFTAGLNSRAVVAADFDQNGTLDLATGNQFAANVSVLSNTTAFKHAAFSFGTQSLNVFADISASRPGFSSGSAGFAAADFDRDGKPDFIGRAANQDAVIVVLPGRSTATYTVASPYSGHMVADVNGDGNTDFITFSTDEAGAGTLFRSFIGDGDGGFRPSNQTRTVGIYLTACTAGDLNRDRFADLACVEDTNRGGALFILRGTGTGTFRLPATATGGHGMDPQLADINRDGKLDVVLGQTGETWLGDGAGGVTPGPSWEADFNPGWRVAVADVNHDGFVDIISSYDGESIHVLLGSATGFVLPPRQPSADCECGYAFVIADINLDGDPDIVVSTGAGPDLGSLLFVLAGHGDGTFADEGFSFAGADAFAFTPGEPIVADIHGDGLPDVIAPAPGQQLQVLVNQRNETNHAPVITPVDAQLTVSIDALTDQCLNFRVNASDPDQHALQLEWQVAPEGNAFAIPNGRLARLSTAGACFSEPGTYRLTLTVDDGRGGRVSRLVSTITITPSTSSEIVLHVGSATIVGNAWTKLTDATAADGVRLYNPNANAPKVTTPSASPASYATLEFVANPQLTYKLWVRLKADANNWANDSVFIQFSDSTNESGIGDRYRIGTTDALPINLEECTNCGVAGWGWEDDGWGAVNRNGVLLRFPNGGTQRLLIQTREDGVSIDQIVLSSSKYLTKRPGTAKNDTTILPVAP